MNRPIALWILIFWLLFLVLGGFYGGVAMLLDPAGGIVQMEEVLPLLPVPNYFLPGLFLVGIMGVLPLFLIYGLVARPAWSWANSLFPGSSYHWSWLGTVILAVVLLGWLAVQALLIGFRWPIQYVTLTNGLLILMVAFMPSIRRHYSNIALSY